MFAECTGPCELWTDKMSESGERKRGTQGGREGGRDRGDDRSWLMLPPSIIQRYSALNSTLMANQNGRSIQIIQKKRERKREIVVWVWRGDMERERQKEASVVINSCSPLSEAVCRWRAGRLVARWACAGLLTRRRSGPDYHPECSGRSSSLPPGMHLQRSHLCSTKDKYMFTWDEM